MATRPISIKIIGDDSNLRKSLKGATRSVEGFGKKGGKIGAQAGLAFAGPAAAMAPTGGSPSLGQSCATNVTLARGTWPTRSRKSRPSAARRGAVWGALTM